MNNIKNPITGEKMILPGRMSAQVILGCCFEPKLVLRLDFEFAGALQHADHRLHDDLLSINTRCCLLAMVQPELQRTCQLHKQVGTGSCF